MMRLPDPRAKLRRLFHRRIGGKPAGSLVPAHQTVTFLSHNPSTEDGHLPPELPLEAGARESGEGLAGRMRIGRIPVPMTVMGLFVVTVFAALVVTGAIGVLPALLGAVLIIFGQALAIRALRRDIELVGRGLAEILADPDQAEPAPPTASPVIDALWRAISRLNQLWRQRLDRVEVELASSTNVLAALPDPIILVNERREVMRVNAAACELLGENLLGRDLAAALRNPAVLKATDAVLKSGVGQQIEFNLSLQVDRHLRAGIVPLPDHPEDGYAALLILNDLTALKRAEQMRADFVANASHELRTPLSTLIGFIETLQGPAVDDAEAQGRFLTIMQQQAGRMARLVDDLLSLSRIELNEHLPPTDLADPGSILRSVAQTLELKASARGMRIELELDRDLPAIPGDEEELAQLFQNLIDNAIKYARPETAITVSGVRSHKLRPGIAIAVRDRGEGIPRLHLPRLTERFYRIDTARSREMGGTGLGLAIVKHIVNRHRGVLEIDSEIGQGSVFTIHLRAARPRGGEREMGLAAARRAGAVRVGPPDPEERAG
jgi:two-component system phosphate regulon sensor histidine kinase PhoR